MPDESPAPPFASAEFAQAWADWVQCRKDQRKPLKPTTVKYQLRMLAKCTEAQAIATLNKSTESGWMGLFPDAFGPDGKPAFGPGAGRGRVSQRTSYAQDTLADALGHDDPGV